MPSACLSSLPERLRKRPLSVMMAAMESKAKKTTTDGQTYHLGYLFSPLVAATELTATLERELKVVVEKRGGKFIHEVPARMTVLAYSIRKMQEHKRSIFTQAYFGSLYFELVPSKLPELEVALTKSALIVRFLLVVCPSALINPEPRKSLRRPNGNGGEPVAPVMTSEKVIAPIRTQEAIDKEIEGLLAPELK